MYHECIFCIFKFNENYKYEILKENKSNLNELAFDPFVKTTLKYVQIKSNYI